MNTVQIPYHLYMYGIHIYIYPKINQMEVNIPVTWMVWEWQTCLKFLCQSDGTTIIDIIVKRKSRDGGKTSSAQLGNGINGVSWFP